MVEIKLLVGLFGNINNKFKNYKYKNDSR